MTMGMSNSSRRNSIGSIVLHSRKPNKCKSSVTPQEQIRRDRVLLLYSPFLSSIFLYSNRNTSVPNGIAAPQVYNMLNQSRTARALHDLHSTPYLPVVSPRFFVVLSTIYLVSRFSFTLSLKARIRSVASIVTPLYLQLFLSSFPLPR